MSDDDGTLTLADGTVINMRTGRPVRNGNVAPGYVAVPTSAEAVREVTRVRRRLADLPEVPERLNIVSCIAAYYMFGLDDYEIAHALGITEAQVGRIKTTEAFGKLIEAITSSVTDGAADDVRALIEQKAHDAAGRIITLMDSDDDKVAVVAAKDILDRAGHRPADVIEHRHKVEGGLTIEYVKRDRNDELPVIDLQAEDV